MAFPFAFSENGKIPSAHFRSRLLAGVNLSVWLVVTAATIVIPAKAGIQDNQRLGHRPAPV
jgi:hypothetical protein